MFWSLNFCKKIVNDSLVAEGILTGFSCTYGNLERELRTRRRKDPVDSAVRVKDRSIVMKG